MTREQRFLAWAAVLAGAGFLLHLLSAVLMPFVVGVAIAYFFDPLAGRLERIGLSRPLAAGAILLGFFIVMAGAALVIFPALQRQIAALVHLIPNLIEKLRHLAEPLLAQLPADLNQGAMVELKDAAGKYAGTLLKWLSQVIAGIWSGGIAILNLLSLLLITPLVAFYMLRDWDHLVAKINGWLPRDMAPTIRVQAKKIDDTMAGFVRGQASVCLVLAIFYAIGLSMIGLKAGLLIGIGAGILAFIPYIGAAVSFMIGVGMALAQFGSPGPVIAVAAIFIVGQTAESYFLTPKLVGGRVGLSPIWIIFAMLAFGTIFGFTGVLIALPVAAVTGVLVRFGLESYLASDLYHGGLTKDSAGNGSDGGSSN
ncbi:MAG: AI-2E family transporter [Proteobacteria bacterium]|nr:AI-2E family transporter [Pseudomonadota bacterium]